MTDRFRFHPRVSRVPGDPLLHGALARLSRVERPVLLDSAAGSPRRFSLLGFDPVMTAEIERLSDLRQLLDALEPCEGDDLPDFFHGGFLGALAYDLGVEGEGLDLPGEPWGFPLVGGGLYVDFLVRDEQRGETWLVLGDQPGDERVGVDERRTRILDQLAQPSLQKVAAQRPAAASQGRAPGAEAVAQQGHPRLVPVQRHAVGGPATPVGRTLSGTRSFTLRARDTTSRAAVAAEAVRRGATGAGDRGGLRARAPERGSRGPPSCGMATLAG